MIFIFLYLALQCLGINQDIQPKQEVSTQKLQARPIDGGWDDSDFQQKLL